MLVGGPGDGEMIPGIHNHGTYFRFRTDEERARLGDCLGDFYEISRDEAGLIGCWRGGEPTDIQ